ncbi:hypothetical protein K502DRAFT_342241 [Neoconidiobolus thromboides FSU 785]|nr:hypothetical protein K502DRAFT_342241 [Neoconidiobolus thromboides FSU 785]
MFIKKFAISALCLFPTLLCKLVEQKWTLTEAKLAPDNYVVDGVLINGGFPGPQITAEVGDTIQVLITNQLHKNVTIHWHGITQRRSVKADGVPMVTQDPIQPGQQYTYKFNVNDQSGTYWYHAHTDMDAEHIYGALIIKDKKEIWDDIVKFNPAYKYDEELTIMLSERWHKTTEELMYGLNNAPFRFSNQSQSILTNGRTYGKWDNNLNGGTAEDLKRFNNGFSVTNIKANKTYRIRLIAANGYSLFSFNIENHNLTVIEAEGTLVDPVNVDRVELSSGQRYSVLLRADQKVDNYYMYTQVSDELRPEARKPVAKNGVSILHYDGAKSTASLIRADKQVPGLKYEYSHWIESKLFTSQWYNKGLSTHYYPVPKKADKELNLIVTLRKPNDLARWFVNDVENQQRNTVLVDDMESGKYKLTKGIYEINEGDNVQIIVQHTMPPGLPCEAHPWHLHGHSFYVVAHGNGFYDPKVDGPKIDDYLATTKNTPVLRDTYTHFITDIPEIGQPLNQTNSRMAPIDNHIDMFSNLKHMDDNSLNPDDLPCGWYAIRFKANNPGSWFMHCHMSPHIIMGKVAIINYVPKK